MRAMRIPRAALAIVFLTTLLSPLWRELFAGDETKYSQVVREMRAGAFFLPTLEGNPFTHKPPLHFWIVDGLTYVFGVYSIWPFVLPSLIAFALLLVLLWKIEGPLAAFVCGTAVMVWGSAQTARMDVSFTLLLVYAAWMLQHAFDDGAVLASGAPSTPAAPETRTTPLVRAAIATGIATLVKGPMAPVIIGCLFAFEALRRRRVPKGNYALAIGAMVVIPLAWLVGAVAKGGRGFWHEVFYKQTVGRAVGAWVHQSPPWFYVMRAPLTLLPWFFLVVVAIIAVYRRGDERAKLYVSWMLAVLVPYSLLSSKLDVYMMALIPPAALAIARLLASDDAWTRWGRNANALMATIFLTVGILGLFIQRPEISRYSLRPLFGVLAIAAAIALAFTIRGRLAASTIALGLVPLAALTYAAVALVPLANELASTRPLVRALVRQRVPAEQIALYVCPHLWTRGMPPALEHVRYVDADELRHIDPPRLIVARRKDSGAIYDVLREYKRVDELQMIGKWFDVYRR
jgi:4-amino-4-deoxy-L-arabinose transferase-like glycosyltransferase